MLDIFGILFWCPFILCYFWGLIIGCFNGNYYFMIIVLAWLLACIISFSELLSLGKKNLVSRFRVAFYNVTHDYRVLLWGFKTVPLTVHFLLIVNGWTADFCFISGIFKELHLGFIILLLESFESRKFYFWFCCLNFFPFIVCASVECHS